MFIHFLKNFNIVYSFSTVRVRAFIFNVYIPCDKTFHVVSPRVGPLMGKEVKDVFGRPGARVGVGSAR